MNKIQFEILRLIKAGDKYESELFGSKLFKNPSTIINAYEDLEKTGFLADGSLTDNAEKLLEEHRIDNAVILAAGMSTRFVPFNYEKPKGLLEVKGEVLIERQIRQLREKSIEQIIIVVGHMKEQFEYLVDKFGVVLVETDDYAVKNNHASVYAARDYLKNTIITSSDLYFTDNIFQTYAYDAYYCTIFIPGKTAERGVETNDDDRIFNTFYGDKCYDIWVTLERV